MGLGSNLTSYQVAAITFLCKAGPSKCEITELTGVSKRSGQRWTKKLKGRPCAGNNGQFLDTHYQAVWDFFLPVSMVLEMDLYLLVS